MLKLFSKNSPTLQTDGRTDRETDRQTDDMRSQYRALHYGASGGKKEREGKEGTQSHKTLYFSYLWGRHPGLIPIKFGMCVAPRNVINVSNFCNKISGVSDLQGVKIPVFPLTLLVIVTTVLRYRVACDTHDHVNQTMFSHSDNNRMFQRARQTHRTVKPILCSA